MVDNIVHSPKIGNMERVDFVRKKQGFANNFEETQISYYSYSRIDGYFYGEYYMRC
jgi:hypothetical protein